MIYYVILSDILSNAMIYYDIRSDILSNDIQGKTFMVLAVFHFPANFGLVNWQCKSTDMLLVNNHFHSLNGKVSLLNILLYTVYCVIY